MCDCGERPGRRTNTPLDLASRPHIRLACRVPLALQSSLRATTGLLIGACLAASAVIGCRRTPEMGPQFVALIVDSSASVSKYQPYLLQYAKLALDDYARNGDLKVTVINLNEAPSVEFQKEGTLYEEDVEDVVNHVKAIDYDATGTNIIAAFELVEQYYPYEKVKPEACKILCFTDGIIEGGKFRAWGDHDWAKLQSMDASLAVYFVDPGVRDEVERALKPLGRYFVKNKNDAVDDLKQEEPKLP